MKPKRKKQPAEFAPDEERLAALARTAEELAEPPGTDLRILVGEALDTYWAARESTAEVSDEQFKFVDETIALARTAARKMVSPVGEFFSDFVSTIAPTLITVLVLAIVSGAVALRGERVPAGWLPYLTVAIPLTLGLVASLVFFRSGSGALTRWNFLRQSTGAIAGGALLAGLLLGYGAWQRSVKQRVARELRVSSTALAQDQLEELSLSSMELRRAEGRFLKVPSSSKASVKLAEEFLNLRTQSYQQQRAVYEASAVGFSGRFVAEVSLSEGSLYYQRGADRELRSTFLYGKIQEVDENGFSILRGDGSKEILKLSKGPFLSTPVVGTYVIVAIDSETNMAMKLVSVKDKAPQEIEN